MTISFRSAVSHLICLGVLAVGFLAAAPVAACSVTSDYVRPSNFELVQIADVILVASAVSEGKVGDEPSVAFAVESAVKGEAPSRLVLPGADLGQPRPSNLADLSGPNPEAMAGTCNRVTFRKG